MDSNTTREIEEYQEIADELLADKHGVDPDRLPADMEPWIKGPVSFIDKINLFVGRVVCWLVLPTMGVMVYEIVARYFFLAPTMWAFDLSRMFYGALYMLGSGYALSQGVHIRADFIYRNWSSRNQAGVDLALYLLFYFPGLIMFQIMSLDFAMDAFEKGERGNGHRLDADPLSHQIRSPRFRPAPSGPRGFGIPQMRLRDSQRKMAL